MYYFRNGYRSILCITVNSTATYKLETAYARVAAKSSFISELASFTPPHYSLHRIESLHGCHLSCGDSATPSQRSCQRVMTEEWQVRPQCKNASRQNWFHAGKIFDRGLEQEVQIRNFSPCSSEKRCPLKKLHGHKIESSEMRHDP